MSNDNIRYRYPLDLQLFAEEAPPTDPETPPADPQDPPKMVPQDEVDRIVADRLARERKKYGDYDDIKAKLADLEKAEDERKKAELSEVERLAAELDEARKKAQEAEERGTSAITAANKRLINAEFKALAREHNIPADRLNAALKLADLSGVTVDDDGNAQGVEDAVKALVEANPYLVEKAQPKQIGGGTGGSGAGNEDEYKMLEQQLIEAKKAKDFSKVIEISNKLKKK